MTMERLFIQVQNGEPINHPMLESNLASVFPHIDMNNLPSDFADFTKVDEPRVTNPYEKAVTTYVSDGSGYTDSWSIVAVTDEEKQEIIRIEKEDFAQRDGPESWIWVEENCKFIPPVPYPDDFDTVQYRWNEDVIGWERVDD